MDRRRKGYLLRKTDYLDHLNYNFKPQINGNAVCSCNKSSAKSYDLQTQTITFEEEPPVSVPLAKKFSEGSQKVPDNSISMDQDLEFYPVDDHPTPSTFTAWDAFLAGNQAFFREPPSLLPDPAFSYMDVIPEEDDLEALLESDTDDTGSSVSTVIDRFSRTSTANSSFSDRCKDTADVTFDLQKVLSPFERLEKELDGDDSKDGSLRSKVIPRGPIVVITNSSSCEDVHSAEEEENFKTSESSVQRAKEGTQIGNCKTDKTVVNSVITMPEEPPVPNESNKSETNDNLAVSNKSSNIETKTEATKTPQVPARSKLLNGSKSPNRALIKSAKVESTPPSSSSKKKKSYPTPSVPPRMSKHLPARRTRSDPGTPDQPSRIPRPITNANRSPTTNSSPKSNAKNNRSPKMNTNKKLKFVESPKSSRSVNKTTAVTPESPVLETKNKPAINKKGQHQRTEKQSVVRPTFEDNFVDDFEEVTKSRANGEEIADDKSKDVSEVVSKSEQIDTKCNEVVNIKASGDNEPVQESNNLIETYETVPSETTTILVLNNNQPENNSSQNTDHFLETLETSAVSSTSEEHPTNPFRKNETNPFKSVIESKNPFVVCNNPFEESPEVTPVLQPKGQMSASLIAPPIPERPSLIASQRQRNTQEQASDATYNDSPSLSGRTVDDPEVTCVEPLAVEEGNLVFSKENPLEDIPLEKTDVLTTTSIHEAIEAALNDMDMMEKKAVTTESSLAINSDQNDQAGKESPDNDDKISGPQRPIEDILQALDQLVLSAPREVEISIDWGVRGPVNIREKTVLPSDASGDRSDISETDGLTEDRRRDIETLLKEVDECLKLHKASEDLSTQQPTEEGPLPSSDSLLSASERTLLGPGSLDAPTAGSTPLNLCHHDEQSTSDTNILLEHSPSEMLKHQSQAILAGEQRVGYSVPYQETFSKVSEHHLDEESIISKHHSSGCDDSGVFLEDPIASSPETQSRSAVNRLQSTLDKLSSEPIKMRQYSIHEGLDSDAEKSDDLGLASSSIDSADDLDGDPLPSTLQISSCSPVVTTRQKPPPVPARKSVSKSSDYQKNNNRYYSETTALEVPSYQKSPLSKSSSSGEDSNFGEGDHCLMENSSTTFSLSEKSKNMINQQKNEQSRSNFAMTRSFHEDQLLNQQRDSNQDSKTNFLARTLSTSVKKFDVSNGNSSYSRRISEQPSSFKWKSEECLRTAAENKWSLPGRRHEKSVSVKDRIAMFSEMETNQVNGKRDDLQRYGSENNIKAITVINESKKTELPTSEHNKTPNLLKDSKWHSMHSIAKKPIEKEPSYTSTNMKPAISIPSLASNNLIDNFSNNNYATLPVKLEVEPPKPIVSTYPETQLTNNKRYNYGLYSLKNLKNTENLLSKKAAGSNLLSIIDNRKQSTQKLKGLVIPDKPYQTNGGKELPTIVSSDSDALKDTRRASLPITAVTAAKAMSLPRNKKLECVPAQRQTSLTEPPWKNENNSSYTLPKYSPAFKKRSLELPGSSLSPTPPSSITSPMSPPPSSPSSICSSNASSTLQQNVFQFSLSHSKPVQPLQPEKALMSPPSMPSDVEYEGDNSEDSSHSASPMRGSARNNKDMKTTNQQTPGSIHFGKSNAFTSSAKSIPHQPMMVETLVKSPAPLETESPKPKAAIYLSKTEILLKKDETKPDLSSRDQDLLSNEFICKNNDQTAPIQDIPIYKTNGNGKDDYLLTNMLEIQSFEKKNSNLQYSNEYFSSRSPSNNDMFVNVSVSNNQNLVTSETNQQDIPVGKFRALPMSLKESESMNGINNSQSLENKHKKNHEASTWENGRPLHSECDESDDDSHSTLSHRTEDSRHTTTDDCLSDATTDSFEKPRLLPEPSHLQRSMDDNASTEGYLSDASTDVSIRRFSNRQIDGNAYSTEEYLSDATAESPDPDWISNRGSIEQHAYSQSKSYGRSESINHSSFHARDEEGVQNVNRNVDPADLRPRRLSQQRTVLKAAAEPVGSVQKFKALAEKWEQRADVISPPPPAVVPVPLKKELKTQSIATGIISSSCVTSSQMKGKSTLPPSLMPRNSSEKKTSQSSKSSSKESVFSVRTMEKEIATSIDGIVTRKSISSTSAVIETSPGWIPQPDELNQLESFPRRDSSSSASSSSKTTLKDDEVFDSTPPPLPFETNGFDDAKYDVAIPPTINHSEENVVCQMSQRSSQVRQEDIFTNEPRNRRGADFSRTNTLPDWHKSNRPAFGAKSTFSVSDIRRSFENGSKEVEKLLPAKKPPMPAARLNTPVTTTPPPVPTRRPSVPSEIILENDDEIRTCIESARSQLRNESVSHQLDVLTVVLRREGEGGGSVGITLAGGADYEVKEITVHKVISGSIADRDGRVAKGDRVMFINGRDLRGVSHGEALHILKAPSPKVILVLARDRSGQILHQNGTAEKETKRRQDYGNSNDSEVIVVELLKDAAGLGFSIEGGRDSPQGDRPLLIKRIFKGGATDKDGQLEEGDEIISVNDQPVINMTRTEAWNFLKKLPEGPVLLKARKVSSVA